MASVTPAQGTELLKDSSSSDLTLAVGPSKFPVHKILLRVKSRFFKSCIDGPYQEAQKNVIEIKDTSPFIVALLLLYIYTHNVDFEALMALWPALSENVNKANENDMELFTVYMDLYQLADRLLIADVKPFVGEKIVTIAFKNGYSYYNQRYGPEMLKRIYEALSHTDRVRVDITTKLVPNRSGVREEMAKLVRAHEPAAWEVVNGK